MTPLPKDQNGCPFLILAPMEGLADTTFRKTLSFIGGFDEAVREFIRVPKNAHVKSLAKVYHAEELGSTPLAAQIMGSDPYLMAEMAKELESRKAPRIDINCGCPSNIVTGRGAGSSLLKDPNLLYRIAHTIVNTVNIPVTIKMRSGYDDTSLFKENILAAEASGVKFITLHPRTKKDGYIAPAQWHLIREAKALLKIPVVGNGDIVSIESALEMLETTKCDGLMIGRGCVINPFLFQEIKAHFAKTSYTPQQEALESFLWGYFTEITQRQSPKGQIHTLKQLMGHLFLHTPKVQEKRMEMLKLETTDPLSFFKQALILYTNSRFL